MSRGIFFTAAAITGSRYAEILMLQVSAKQGSKAARREGAESWSANNGNHRYLKYEPNIVMTNNSYDQ
jgi:hypothetical protein